MMTKKERRILFLHERSRDDPELRMLSAVCARLPSSVRTIVAAFDPRPRRFERASQTPVTEFLDSDFIDLGDRPRLWGPALGKLTQGAGKEPVTDIVSFSAATDRLALAAARRRRGARTYAWRTPGPVLNARSGWAGLLEAERLRRMTGVAASSRAGVEALRRTGVREGQIAVVPPGVDLRAYAGFRPAAGKEGPVLASYGRLTREAGFGTLLFAIDLLRARFPKIKCFIGGEGPARADLFSLAKKLGLSYEISFMGNKSGHLAPLRTASLFVNPNPAEGASLPVLEAMAAGVPVVTTDAGGARELCGDNEAVRLVPPSRFDVLADAVESIHLDQTAQARMSRAAREWVESAGRIERTVQALSDMLNL